MLPSLQVVAFDRNRGRRGPVMGPQQIEATIRRNLAGEATFTVDSDHPRVDDLVADGARAVVSLRDYQGVSSALISGPCSALEGVSGTVGTRTFTIRDDFEEIFGLIGVPNPAGDITQQGDEDRFYTVTGPAETVLKDIVGKAAAWHGVQLVVPATAGRGKTITVAVRMDVLADKLFPAVEEAGLLVRVVQLGSQLTLDVSVPTVRTRILTEASGIVSPDPTFRSVGPTVTRVIASTASGEGVTRAFRLYPAGTTRAAKNALEQAWGYVRPAFIEVSGDDADLETLMAQQAAETLTQGAATSAVNAVLNEGENWRYGEAFTLGDQVRIRPRGVTNALTDFVSEVAFSQTPSDGLVITPTVGNFDATTDVDVEAVTAELARQYRINRRNR